MNHRLKKTKKGTLVYPVLRFLALCWFLLRVIPNPQRAMYLFRRAAFPLASSIVIWLVGILLAQGVMQPLIACTAFSVYKNGTAYFCNNEDYVWNNTYIEFIPASEGKYGRVFVGYKHIPSPQGGMNDQGLCYDKFATPYLSLHSAHNRPNPPKDLDILIMETCATVDEAVEVYKKYSLVGIERGQIMISDRSGRSVIVEGDEIIEITGDHQVCTNFYQSDPSRGGWPCWRYKKAKEMLEESEEVSIQFAEEIIFACHSSGTYGTKYTNIFDMNTGNIKLYYTGYFDKEITLNLFDELQKGRSVYMMEDLAKTSSKNTAKLPGPGQSVTIFPNPSSSIVNIRFKSENPIQFHAWVYDQTARLIAVLREDELHESEIIKWDVADIEPGVYFILVKLGDNYSTRRVLIT